MGCLSRQSGGVLRGMVFIVASEIVTVLSEDRHAEDPGHLYPMLIQALDVKLLLDRYHVLELPLPDSIQLIAGQYQYFEVEGRYQTPQPEHGNFQHHRCLRHSGSAQTYGQCRVV